MASSWSGQHVLSSDQFDLTMLEALYTLADMLVPVAEGRQHTRLLEGAVLASLFFEPSTRTRLSFDAAFIRLGGQVSHTTGVEFSSLMKGESIADTARVISGYADVMVIRHPDEAAIMTCAEYSQVPVINGGNGAGEHPTQALLDLYTIRAELNRMGKLQAGTLPQGLRVAMVGDLKYGRTIHSLIKLLSLHDQIIFTLVSPPALQCPEQYITLAEQRGHTVRVCHDLAQGIAEADVVYVTRVQQERLQQHDQQTLHVHDFRLDQAKLERFCAADTLVLHPLPRDSRPGAQDLASDTTDDPRVVIFRQSDAGVPVRMALFASILGVGDQVSASLRPVSWRRRTP